MSVSVVVLCAGSGTRMKMDKSKLLILLGGKTVLERSVMAFSDIPEITQRIVVCRKRDLEEFKLILKNYDVEFVVGGETRQQSMFNALRTVENADFIAIHDGARPLVKKESIVSAIKHARSVGGAAIGVPVKDTIKRVDGNSIISETVDRSNLISIQTPQVFDYEKYKECFDIAQKSGLDFTDDCQIFELNALKVALVIGNYDNIKITTPEDIAFANSILKSRGELT